MFYKDVVFIPKQTYFWIEAQASQHQLILLPAVQSIVWTAATEWKRCATCSPKNKITSPCFEDFCKLLPAQGKPQTSELLIDKIFPVCPFPLSSSEFIAV